MNLTLQLSEMYPQEGFSFGRTIDLRDLRQTSCYCSREACGRIRSELAGGPEGIHHIDSGDFHYITLFFLEQIREDFDLVLIDNHPDDQDGAFGGDLLSCGSWVARARESIGHMKTDVRASSAGSIPSSGLPVYLSIDLDALREDEFGTDWDQGDMSLRCLRSIIDAVRGRRLIGVDICGGITLEKGGTGAGIARNRQVREFISSLFCD